MLISKSKPYYFYISFPSSTLKLARNMKFPLALPITAPVIIAGNDMGRSAIFHFSAQVKWLCWKANIILAASGLAHFSVPLGLRKSFLSAGLADGDKPPTSLIYSVSCKKWLDSSTQNCLPFPSHWLQLFSTSLWKKERQKLLKRKPSCRMQAKVPRYPYCWFSYQRTEINCQVFN